MKPSDMIIDLNGAARPPLAAVPEKLAPDIAFYNANRATARRVSPLTGIRGMVIHATAGGSAGGALAWWKNPAAQASAHWVIPDEDDPGHGQYAIAAVYEAMAAWHVRNTCRNPAIHGGAAQVNHWSLGVEIVNRQAGGDAYSDWQIAMTAALVRYAWAKYPNFRWVASHAAFDPGRRTDPGTDFPWAKFEQLVRGGTALRAPNVATLAEIDPAKPFTPCHP